MQTPQPPVRQSASFSAARATSTAGKAPVMVVVSIACAIISLAAAAFVWKNLASSRHRATEPSVVAKPEEPAPVVATPPPSPPAPAPAVMPSVTEPAEPAKRVATLTRGDGKTLVVPVSDAPPTQPRPIARPAPAAAPANLAPAVVQPTAPKAPDADAHTRAARAHAAQFFGYKYKIGSTDYLIISGSIRIESTEEVPSWNRYRSTGEVGMEYYDNSGFKRTTRRFEVLTENQNGTVKAVDVTVK